jgi:hypothetical protein
MMLDVEKCVGTIIKWRRGMRQIQRGDVNCLLMQRAVDLKLRGFRRVILRGGRQARRKGRWANANMVAHLKRRVLGPFMTADEIWRASRLSRGKGFKLGMGLAELRARMRMEGARWLGWYVYRFRRVRALPTSELVWLGSRDGDGRGGEFLECGGGTRFYAPGGPFQPKDPVSPGVGGGGGVLPARWKAMHAVRCSPGASRELPPIPKRVGWKRATFIRRVVPAEEERIDLTLDSEVAPCSTPGAVKVVTLCDADRSLDVLEEGLWDAPSCCASACPDSRTYAEVLIGGCCLP